jgi:7-keto-8-aminopelargonate synthetase-like enzyme
MKKNILISGGTGFIGRHLIENLCQKFCLYIISNQKQIEFNNKNIKYIKFKNYRDLKKKLNGKRINFIIHAATYFSKIDDIKKINKIINANIILGSYLLELSKEKNVEKFINFASTWENFNGIKDNPKNFYAASKLCFNMKKIFYGMAVYDSKEINACMNVLKKSSLTLMDGPKVKALEKKVSSIFGKKYGLMVNSGSSANLLALSSINLKKNDEIITPALNFLNNCIANNSIRIYTQVH